ncbi:hypothetical protein HYH02_011549 [Chlamydomonas schloesseri]|uniref:Uncharacterized protein n=1 Tax=Chlamydomonas schloesseri TaxID=2026947 RepID=A0A835T0K5_9CHLO|nr:hypothetical protein HYH02_011549 [Chlamydomonas schloesseri]|eukprot:KAG2436614.1 hypothetical protein HYH02_011549 [Chlamydomonas schloesseri]
MSTTKEQHATGASVRSSLTAPADARKLLSLLRAAKTQQDLTAQPARGRGLWLNTNTWQAVVKQLELQLAEVEALQRQIHERDQLLAELRGEAAADRQAQQRTTAALQAQIGELLGQVANLQAQLAAKTEAWEQHKRDLEAQADNLLALLHDRQGLLADNDGLQDALAAAQAAAAAAERRAADAEARATELQRMHEYMMGKAESGLTERDSQAMRIRDLTTTLAEARHQADTYRLQLQSRSQPAEELTRDLKRLQADNRRLVALLATVPEYRVMAGEVAGEHGCHYIPLEECLMARHLVEDLHPQLLDRPVREVAGGLAGPGRLRDPDGPDPALTVVLDEQYHWVPRKALETGAALMRRMMPALPMSQLLTLVAELNKVWRDREKARLAEVAAAHAAEIKRLTATFKQRAPYEAVVAGEKLNDLKRRLKAQAAQSAALAAAARGDQKRGEEDCKAMLHAGLSTITDLSRQVARLSTRNKKLSVKAAKKRAEAEARGQPVCSSCLDRLLLPASNEAAHYLGRALGVETQAPAPPGGPAAVAAAYPSDSAAATAGTPPGAGGGAVDASLPFQQYQLIASSADGEGPYHEPRLYTEPLDAGAAFRSQASAAGGGGRGGGGEHPAWMAPAPATVRVNLVQPPASPPPPPLSTMSVWRQREAAAAAAAAAGTPTRHSMLSAAAAAAPEGRSHASTAAATGAAVAGSAPSTTLLVEPTADGVSITALNASAGAGAGPGLGLGLGLGGSEAGGPEQSAFSLSEWRSGPVNAGAEPVTVQLQMGGGPGASPGRQLLLAAGGAVPGQALQGGAGGGSSVAAQQRGTPVRVSVRFPRHDMPGSSLTSTRAMP